MNDVIVKADRRGRLRYTKDQRNVMVDAYESSGLSGPRFAAMHGVNYQTFAGWLHRRKLSGSSARPAGPRELTWVPAELEPTVNVGNTSTLEVVLPGGSKLLVTTPSQARLAAALIRDLAAQQPC